MSQVKITPKQEKFAKIFVDTGNASYAYRSAYKSKAKPNSVYVGASKLLNSYAVQEYVRKLREDKRERFILDNSIPVSQGVFSSLVSHFGCASKAERWASSVIAKASLEIGLDIKTQMRGTISKTSRYTVLERAGFKCQACGESPDSDNSVILHIDHIVPSSLGGSDDESNLQVLCRDCNISKGNKFAVNHNE